MVGKSNSMHKNASTMFYQDIFKLKKLFFHTMYLNYTLSPPPVPLRFSLLAYPHTPLHGCLNNQEKPTNNNKQYEIKISK